MATGIRVNVILFLSFTYFVLGYYIHSMASNNICDIPNISPEKQQQLVLATYADDNDDLYWATVMGESIRTFGGGLHDTPIRLYLNATRRDWDQVVLNSLDSLNIDVRLGKVSDDFNQYPYAYKNLAAGVAEAEAETETSILAWLDPDMIFVKEPSEFILKNDFDLGYRPVQLVNISSVYEKPLDDYWDRIFLLIGVPESAIFPMTTTVDNVVIRPHFNAGMIVVRPAKGILRRWSENFKTLAYDSALADMCKYDKLRNIYLHQAALAATILSTVAKDRMYDLPSTYNYAVFLTEKMANKEAILSLDNVVMFRHGQHYTSIEKLENYAGSTAIFSWLKNRWRP